VGWNPSSRGAHQSCAENPGRWSRSAVGMCLTVYAPGLRRSHPSHPPTHHLQVHPQAVAGSDDGPPNTTWTREQLRGKLTRRRSNRGGRHVQSCRWSVQSCSCVCDWGVARHRLLRERIRNGIRGPWLIRPHGRTLERCGPHAGRQAGLPHRAHAWNVGPHVSVPRVFMWVVAGSLVGWRSRGRGIERHGDWGCLLVGPGVQRQESFIFLTSVQILRRLYKWRVGWMHRR
jgi:hypothetical protein